MKNRLLCYIAIIFVLSAPEVLARDVRNPAVAGAFYTNNPKKLREQINTFLGKTELNTKGLPKGQLIGLVVPHAGYTYSGGIAAFCYKLLLGKQYDTVVILGPNHRAWGFNNISIYNKGVYKTPLGEVSIDTEYADKILKQGNFTFYQKAHIEEHSIEVQVPFLQVVLKNFKIVPIVMGDYSRNACERLANAILENKGNRKILLIASCDLSHDKPYKEAVEMDKLGLNLITSLDTNGLINAYSTRKTEMCGYGPVLTLMLLAKELGGVSTVLLDYANSGDVTGNKYGRIVGYGAVAFYQTNSHKTNEGEVMNKKEDSSNEYSSKERKALLELARNAINDYLSKAKTGDYTVTSSKFKENRGVFVTLHKKGQLRGCIGYIEPIKPLQQAVIDNAVNAATKDFRFSNVTPAEMKDIDIEISVLTVPSEIKSPEEFIPGKHGIIIRKGKRSAVFLPQVAPEQGWGMEETLTHLCMKAGLAPDEWREEGMKFFVFTASVFGEKENE